MAAADRLKHDLIYRNCLELMAKDPLGLRKRVLATQCARPGGLLHFVRLTWPCVEPDRDFVENWHIQAICDHLEAVTYGHITRLLINVPPGFMKSIGCDEPILTTSGWKSHGELRPGDFVFGPDGKPKHVLGKTPAVLEPAYKIIFDDGTNIVAGPGHEWSVERDYPFGAENGRRRCRKPEVVTTLNLRPSTNRHAWLYRADRIPVAHLIEIPPKRTSEDDLEHRLQLLNNERPRHRYVMRIEPIGERFVNCISVEGHLYVVGKQFLTTRNSLLLNVFWPAWEWGPLNRPSMRYVAASYSQDLTIRDNVKFRQIITSDIYREHWNNFGQGLQFNLEKVGNDRTGWKLATSVGGVGTGERGDRIIIDDPNNVKDAESDTVRDSTNRWFTEVIPNRYNDPEKSAIIVIQQRTHEEDVSGIITSRGLDYEHLMIPMRYDSTRRYTTTIGWTDPRGLDAAGEETDENEGALAWVNRYTPKVVEREESTLGPYAFAGQYQQAPVPRGGAIFERDWWQPWPIHGNKIRFPDCEYVVAAVDTAFTEKQENDYSAMTVWGIFRDSGDRLVMPRHIDDLSEVMRLGETERPKVVLMWAWQKRLSLHGPPDDRPIEMSREEWNSPYWLAERQKHWGLVEWVSHTARAYKIDHLLIETQAAGLHLEQELRRLHSDGDWGVQLVHAKGDKRARAIAVQHLFSNGLVHAPTYDNGQHPVWCGQVVDQFCSFPKTRYKDLVDSGTHALQHLRDTGVLVRKEEHDAVFEEGLHPPRKRKALYDV